MRFMIVVRATKDTEAGVMPEEKLIAELASKRLRLTPLLRIGPRRPDCDLHRKTAYAVLRERIS